MLPQGYQWITDETERIQSGDLMRVRDDEHGEYGEWATVEHLAGTRLGDFVALHSRNIEFCRPAKPAEPALEQPRNFEDAYRRWQQESALVPEGSQWLTDPTEIIQPGDLYRVREDSHSDYCDWRPADHYAGTEVGYFAAWHSRDIQFCRPGKPAPEPQWEMVSDRDYLLRPGVDQVRCRTYSDDAAHWGPWIAWYTVQELQTVGGFINGPGSTAAAQEWQFRRRVTEAKPAVELALKQPPAPTTDRGSKYHRTITQTLPGDTHGLSVTGDVYDLLKAFGVTCPALQHAVKKLLCAGLRGAKSAEQDIEEAILSCRRAIELLEFEL